MSFFLYLTGFAGAAALFFYIVSLYNNGKAKLERKKVVTAPLGQGVAKTQQPIFTIPPGERMCPLCRTILSKREALYASKIALHNTHKLLILGCQHCYKDE
ncbi:MAG: hypothetical protein FWG92_00455 [Leptospirales bacterium]|nr:hypothetical protein [Leptospirales bacterium]